MAAGDLRIRRLASPNHDARPAGTPVDMLVVHYTGMRTAEEAIARLRDPAAKVSAHYVIDEDGSVLALVPEDRRAWHAGVASWRGHRDVNARSIGIELVNPGHEFGYRDFPAAQMAAFVRLARAILARHPIPPRNVVGHSDVAPARKADPGERFDWEGVAKAGIGLWPRAELRLAAMAGDGALAAAQRQLAGFGYEIAATGIADETTAQVLTAFQRHFRPARLDGVADAETLALIAAVAAAAAGEVA